MAEEVELLEGLAADLAYGVVTLRARADREARDAERTRLVTAIEQTAESVEITAPDATILYVNPAFEQVTGYTAAEVIGQNPRILQSGFQTPAFYADLWATLTSGATWTGELVNRKKDGTTFIEEATITPIVDARGTLTSYVAVKRDVTHLREIETTLEGAARQRAQIAATLSRLEAGETPEATAQSIADALLGIEGMGSPAILAFDDAGRAVVLGASGGSATIYAPIPRERSAYLLERAKEGPWAEPFVARDDDPEADGTPPMTAGGSAAIYAPIPGEGGPIGLLAVRIPDAEGADDLAARLATLVEFAPTARLLLEAPLRARWATARSRARIEAVITTAAFRPVFQPIVDMATRQPVGYEALTRFDDGIPPDRAFADAGRCGLGQDLELATLRAAIAASDALPAECFVSLNVSPALILEGHGLRSILTGRTRPVVLEITEHAAVEDYEALRSAFVALGAGLRLAVDDAGAGVANFNHLVELRPQFVKVDIGLVRGVNADLTRQALIVALAHFAGATDCRVIAEGIETEAERAVLERLEVPLGQGYLFGRPADARTWGPPTGDEVAVRPVLGTLARGGAVGRSGRRIPRDTVPHRDRR
jgi:PAS domain S-box-containing protein